MAEIDSTTIYNPSLPTYTQPFHQDALQAKVDKWKEITKKKYSDKRKFGYKPLQKDLLPPEILRYPPHTEKSSKTIAICPAANSGMTNEST